MRVHADPEKYIFLFTADVDECEEIEAPCTGNQVCINTIGDYRCTMGKTKLITSTTIMIIIKYVSLTDPTILIIIIICASGGLALMCITPIIILVTCFYYRRRKGDMKHSTSYDNLIPEEEPDIDQDMYKHLEEEDIKRRKGLGVDIERRISLLEQEGLVDNLSPTKKDIAVTYIDDVDEEKEDNILQKLTPKKPEKPNDEEEKKPITYIDTAEPDDKPKNELKEKWKSAKRHSIDKKDDSFIEEEPSDSDKTKLIQKQNDRKSGPVKPIDEDEKEDLSYIDEADTDDKTKKVQQNHQKVGKPKEDDKFKHRRVETDIQRRIRELQGKKDTGASNKKT